MRVVAIVASIAIGCSFEGASRPGDTPSDGGNDALVVDAESPDALDATDAAPGTARKKRVTIAHLNVFGAHDDFPVWFVVDDLDLVANALPDASDVHFTAIDGTPIPYERMRFDPNTGHLEAWVRLDLADMQDTLFDMRYGDKALAHAPDPPSVFANGYRAVWHLETPTTIPDATGTNPGTPMGLAASQEIDGKLGRAINFDGGAKEIAFTNPLAGTTPHTISLWVNQRDTSDNDALVVLGNSNCGASRWLHSRYQGPTLAYGFYCNDRPNPQENIIGAGWTLIHWVFENNRSRIYRNGAEVDTFEHSTVNNPVNTAGAGGHIGWAPGGWGQNMGANAIIDEVRIANVARTLEYVATEHINQTAPNVFCTVGPELPAP